MNPELQAAYHAGKLVLFVGAGVSASLNLPTWGELVDHMAEDLGYDAKVFSTYGDPLTLAEYYKRRRGGLGHLRSWMDREWHKAGIDVSRSDVHRLIAQGNFSRIYTTNYDRWLEAAHDEFGIPYDKIASVSDLVTTADGRRQIVKFHGDFIDDDSLVLDETSYFRRLNFDTPLDVKLSNDILGNSVLFIGYSLRDINIRLLFFRLAEMWNRSTLASARPKSYLFMSRPNPVAEEILGHRGIQVIATEEDDPKLALASFLEDLIN